MSWKDKNLRHLCRIKSSHRACVNAKRCCTIKRCGQGEKYLVLSEHCEFFSRESANDPLDVLDSPLSFRLRYSSANLRFAELAKVPFEIDVRA